MNQRTLQSLSLILILWMGMFVAVACKPVKTGPRVAQVGSRSVSLAEFQKFLTEEYYPILADIDPRSPEADTMRTLVFDEYIDKILLEEEIKKEKITLTPEEEKAAQAALQEGYTDLTFEKQLERLGILRDDWEAKQKEKWLREKFLMQTVYKDVTVTEEETAAFYRKNKARYRLPDRIHCRHIVTNKKDKADNILKLLKNGDNFVALAEKFSEGPDAEKGGDLGDVIRGQMPLIFEQACFTLNTGQNSEVVQSEYGYHIFLVVEKKPAKTLSLNDVRPDILKELLADRRQKKLAEWIQSVKTSYPIIKEDDVLTQVTWDWQAPQASPSPETIPAAETQPKSPEVLK